MTKESIEDKIIEVTFFDQDDCYDEIEEVGFDDFSSGKASWKSRFLSLGLFLVSIISVCIIFAFLLLVVPLSLFLVLRGNENGYYPVTKRFQLLKRGLVILLASFAGIFSPRFGMAIATAYFTLFDADQFLMDKLQKAMN